MGADYEGQAEAIDEIRRLSPQAKQFLSHHLCNPLSVILGAARLNHPEMIPEQVDHIVEDLILAGIREEIPGRETKLENLQPHRSDQKEPHHS